MTFFLVTTLDWVDRAAQVSFTYTITPQSEIEPMTWRTALGRQWSVLTTKLPWRPLTQTQSQLSEPLNDSWKSVIVFLSMVKMFVETLARIFLRGVQKVALVFNGSIYRSGH